jgi:hypothetical protein
MNAEPQKNSGIDELLRKALADDLPAAVASGMRRRIEGFLEEKMGSGAPAERRRAAARTWLFRRTVWAALSILLLAAGIVLQEQKSSSPLADRIAAIKTQYAGLETPRR